MNPRANKQAAKQAAANLKAALERVEKIETPTKDITYSVYNQSVRNVIAVIIALANQAQYLKDDALKANQAALAAWIKFNDLFNNSLGASLYVPNALTREEMLEKEKNLPLAEKTGMNETVSDNKRTIDKNVFRQVLRDAAAKAMQDPIQKSVSKTAQKSMQQILKNIITVSETSSPGETAAMFSVSSHLPELAEVRSLHERMNAALIRAELLQTEISKMLQAGRIPKDSPLRVFLIKHTQELYENAKSNIERMREYNSANANMPPPLVTALKDKVLDQEKILAALTEATQQMHQTYKHSGVKDSQKKLMNAVLKNIMQKFPTLASSSWHKDFTKELEEVTKLFLKPTATAKKKTAKQIPSKAASAKAAPPAAMPRQIPEKKAPTALEQRLTNQALEQLGQPANTLKLSDAKLEKAKEMLNTKIKTDNNNGDYTAFLQFKDAQWKVKFMIHTLAERHALLPKEKAKQENKMLLNYWQTLDKQLTEIYNPTDLAKRKETAFERFKQKLSDLNDNYVRGGRYANDKDIKPQDRDNKNVQALINFVSSIYNDVAAAKKFTIAVMLDFDRLREKGKNFAERLNEKFDENDISKDTHFRQAVQRLISDYNNNLLPAYEQRFEAARQADNLVEMRNVQSELKQSAAFLRGIYEALENPQAFDKQMLLRRLQLAIKNFREEYKDSKHPAQQDAVHLIQLLNKHELTQVLTLPPQPTNAARVSSSASTLYGQRPRTKSDTISNKPTPTPGKSNN